MTYKEKLSAIRSQMEQNGVDAYIIPSSDPHISEYLPDHYKCMEWTSGFSGSAGTLVITADFAGLWTDARYFVQAVDQLKDTGFELVKLKIQHTPEYIEWLAEKLQKGATVAFDGKLISAELVKIMKVGFNRFGFNLNTKADFITPIWENRPAFLNNPVFLLPEDITGESTESKIARLRADMKKQQVDFHLISSMDDIAWLLNVRGSDVDCNPLVLSHVLVSQNELVWFVNDTRITPADKAALAKSGVDINCYMQFATSVSALPAGNSVLIDPKKLCQEVMEAIPSGVSIVEGMNPTTMFKSIKNKTEQQHIRQTMVNDGVAMVKFLKWLEDNIGKTYIDELSASAKLYEFRSAQPGFVGESFGTISAYKGHAALPHYKSTPESNVELKPEGIYLVDSGGQYRTGTTDITRTISLGNSTAEEKKDYTLVLKGMIDLSMARFPEGTKGYQLDAFSRRWLWQEGYNFGHGTGHGVGFFLNVHEGPQNISVSGAINIAFQPGMLNSNEPGIYRPEKHGIRIENLVICQEDVKTEFGQFLNFETVTICPIATDLIDAALLNEAQRSWFNDYHKFVFDKLSPLLNVDEQAWLKEKTKAI
ncbi:aminopeptidase P family protein [Solitalea canadensis]|uniref:Xaa-Pro aminopeptidase n=1 Tax=Solitalea canadensis (strain ATCC 29591 / DSM 3403 / JCM 21819 / LMG 8368 / NBRC 15130 / NCIMB 12057 / USAM 9D) TaxID=929556 RepID=H8KP80_SOLCM|nr:aminopeptidase P family protein [Solitalea canadensis]AFD05717.1 Xaa-Pro aminopeptidase [Solitalea canadensis DSM 3403]